MDPTHRYEEEKKDERICMEHFDKNFGHVLTISQWKKFWFLLINNDGNNSGRQKSCGDLIDSALT